MCGCRTSCRSSFAILILHTAATSSPTNHPHHRGCRKKLAALISFSLPFLLQLPRQGCCWCLHVVGCRNNNKIAPHAPLAITLLSFSQPALSGCLSVRVSGSSPARATTWRDSALGSGSQSLLVDTASSTTLDGGARADGRN